VQPASYASAQETVNPSTAWSRVVIEDDTVVGFVQGNFDPEAEESLRSCIWSINVSADHQGHGVGRFAIHGLADEARQRGLDRLTVMYEPGDGGPEAFFKAIGFEVIGETPYGDQFAALSLA
jgi:diamine N-acetyltransferase